MSAAKDRPAKRRRPWLAALLSFLWPGLGQLYIGETRRAVRYFALLVAFYALVASFLYALDAPIALLAGGMAVLILGLALTLGSAIDAFRNARSLGAVVLGRYQRLWIYLGIVALNGVAQEALDGRARFHGGCAPEVPRVFTHTYEFLTRSMEPTLLSGDILVTETSYFCRNDPRRGDLAVFLLPTPSSPAFIKRIIGLPGDRVQLKEGRVYINGEPVAQEWLESGIGTDEMGREVRRARFLESFPDGARYSVEITDLESKLENTAEVTVPEGSYFVLGDARDNSLDSRMTGDFGFIPRALIVDRPAYVIWSGDWDRIGLRLR
ncbi:MAG TPA: signal peptidase I [Stellaceae bacterium]|nr:signal peptidase I [Stellaceae bacterium]